MVSRQKRGILAVTGKQILRLRLMGHERGSEHCFQSRAAVQPNHNWLALPYLQS